MRVVAAIFLSICACAAAVMAPAQETDPFVSLAEEIENNVSKLGGNVLAVMPFTYTDGIKSVEGAMVSERLVETLTERGFVKLVERDMLNMVLEEQELSSSGLVDAASAVQIGKLIGARGVVMGTATEQGEHLEVHARLLSVETAEVVAAFRRAVPRTIKTFMNPLWGEINRIKKENGSFGIKFWADRGQEVSRVPSYRVGETVTLHFEAEKDCHVTIFDFTTSGSIHVLFPNAFMRDNAVKAGRVYTLPDAQAGFRIRVGDPPGIEKLKLFATTKDIPLVRQDYSVESFRSVTRETYSVTRDLQPVIDSLEDNMWAESQLELRIEAVLRGEE